MNVLLTDPYRVAGFDELQQYLRDMDRLNFDIACNSCLAIPLEDITGDLELPYRRFASEAKSLGYKTCIRINSTLSCGDVVGITEAQYHLDDSPDKYGDNGFFASLASKDWTNHLKELTRIFVRDYGYDFVIFDDPILRIDIPGTQDRFHEAFRRTYPGVKYPTEHAESPEYLKVQQLKSQILVDFCRDLVRYAKEVGAEKTGVMLRMFTPATADSSGFASNASCATGRIAALPELDFLVAKQDLNSIYAGNLRTGDEMERSPLICYADVLSHCVGKPVIAMLQTIDEYVEQPGTSQPPKEFSDKALLATTVAAPNGLMVEWAVNGDNLTVLSSEHLPRFSSLLHRMGHQRTPIAFVVSGSGLWHAEPCSYQTSWQFYWHIMHYALYKQTKGPILTLYADALEENLSRNPQVSILLLEEHFPLTESQTDFLQRWWLDYPGRSIIVVGSGMGFSANPDKPGLQPLSESFPGLLDQLGVKQEHPCSINSQKDEKTVLKRGYNEHSPLMPETVELSGATKANIRRIFGSHNIAMYSDREDHPVVIKWSSGSSLGFFCGLDSLSAAPLIDRLIQYTVHTQKIFQPPVMSNSDHVLWNGTRDGYIFVANCSDDIANATIYRYPYAYWDIIEKQLLKDTKVEFQIAPSSLRAFRWTSKTAKLYDVVNAVHIKSIAAGAGRAEVILTMGRKTTFIARNEPREIKVDGSVIQFSAKSCSPFCEINLEGVEPGDHVVTLRW